MSQIPTSLTAIVKSLWNILGADQGGRYLVDKLLTRVFERDGQPNDHPLDRRDVGSDFNQHNPMSRKIRMAM